MKQALGEFFGEGGGGVAEEVEGFAEGRAPLLVPAGLAAVAAAVGAPALDAVGAGPGGVFDDLGLPLRREFGEELAVVGEAGVAVVLDPVHGVGEGHLAVACGGGRSSRRRWRRGRAGRRAAFAGVSLEAVEQAAPKASPLLSRPSKAMAREVGPS